MPKNFVADKLKIQGKQTLFAIALILMLTIAVLITYFPIVNATENVPTYAYLSVRPNPVGVGQTLLVAFWLNFAPPTANGATGDRWQGMTVTVTKPGGTNQTLGPYASDPVGSQWINYVPDTIGTYYFQFSFPGQHIAGVGIFTGPFDNLYMPSTSSVVSITVQQEPIPGYPTTPLPTGFWQRPIEGENREWSTISGNWLQSNYNASGAFNPYTTAPDSAHILWTKPIAFGGIAGGEFGSISYYTGLTYEAKFQPPVVINGRLYYNQRLGSSSWAGLACVDVRTGEDLWFKNDTVISLGQIYDYESPNQHGAIPYLWYAEGPTWRMYDALTGDWILDLANASAIVMADFGARVMYSPTGDMLVYMLDGAKNQLSLWNSSWIPKMLAGDSGPAVWEWRPPLGATLDWQTGIQWTKTVPDVPGVQNLMFVSSDVLIATSVLSTTNPPTVVHIGYSATTGEQLWVQNRSFQIDPETFMGGKGSMLNGVYTIFDLAKMQWHGFDAYTGNELWVTQPTANAWGTYTEGGITGYGKFYAAGYDGRVHCYDLKNGTELWTFYTGSAGFETPYGHWPFGTFGLTIADGKIFAVTGEHSPNSPLWRGGRLYCLDAETGKELWSVLGWWQSQRSLLATPPVVVDGYLISLNCYDGQIYCFGKGQTVTTVDAPMTAVTLGSSLILRGTVTDQSPGQTCLGIPAKGTPAIADANQEQWMEYLYMQKPMPTNATGVPVTLTAFDPNGNTENIGTVTSDKDGIFATSWTPPVPGVYKITATFAGSESYFESHAETAMAVSAAPTAQAPISTPPSSATSPPTATNSPSPQVTETPIPPPSSAGVPTTYIIIAVVAIIVVIAAAALALRRRK